MRGECLEKAIVVEGVRVAFEAVNKLCQAMNEMRTKTSEMVEVSEKRSILEEVKRQVTHLAGGIDAALATFRIKVLPAPLGQ